jgi:hypothetical protein
MPGTHENEPPESRLDRMERLMASLADGHRCFDEEYKRLLEAQARLSDTLDRLNRGRLDLPS